ncbi:MAG: hypothetical protein AAF702_12625 [Chloroflexota bacterium]
MAQPQNETAYHEATDDSEVSQLHRHVAPEGRSERNFPFSQAKISPRASLRLCSGQTQK